MLQEIKTISLPLPYRMGSVNCYLVNTGEGFILIDTGASNARTRLDTDLKRSGCKPGNLKLILITHGDFDHIGNAVYLRNKYGSKIAMHADDSGMLEHGDMFWNRKKGGALLRKIVPLLFRFSHADRCPPDLTVGDGFDLSEFGFQAVVVSIPGHSKGSIGILTGGNPAESQGRTLFCGDLFNSTSEPGFSTIMDDPDGARASLEKLACLNINTIYPGHGGPFRMEQLV